MHRLRSIYGKRWLVALMLASLLPVLFATVSMASQRGTSYAGWLRAQLLEPADAAVEQALAAAVQSDARSLDVFLNTFVAAYEAQETTLPLGHLFAAAGLSGDALMVYLQSRFSQLVGDAVLPRAVFIATQAATSHTSTRPDLSEAVSAYRNTVRFSGLVATATGTAISFVVPLRILSAAQPLGP